MPDALGSTRKLTDKDGVVTDIYSYDAWGNTIHVSGTTEQPYQYVGQLGYYTHYQDENLDLLQLGVRFYDPETGRFTQRDPMHEGPDPYTYVADKPTVAVDPTGLFLVEYMRVRCLCNALARAIELHFEHDKIAHCFFNCRATQCLWPLSAAVVPIVLSLPENDFADIVANMMGGACAVLVLQPFAGCESCCRCTAGRALPPRDLNMPNWRDLWRRSGCATLARWGLNRSPGVL